MLSLSVSFVFFFKQKTAYEMRISDWSSDVCSSDLDAPMPGLGAAPAAMAQSTKTARACTNGLDCDQGMSWGLRWMDWGETGQCADSDCSAVIICLRCSGSRTRDSVLLVPGR